MKAQHKSATLQLASPDLVDVAVGVTHEPTSVCRMAGVRAILRGMADQIEILTNEGNTPLPAQIANGFVAMLREADEDLRTATESARREIRTRTDTLTHDEVRANAVRLARAANA